MPVSKRHPERRKEIAGGIYDPNMYIRTRKFGWVYRDLLDYIKNRKSVRAGGVDIPAESVKIETMKPAELRDQIKAWEGVYKKVSPDAPMYAMVAKRIERLKNQLEAITESGGEIIVEKQKKKWWQKLLPKRKRKE